MRTTAQERYVDRFGRLTPEGARAMFDAIDRASAAREERRRLRREKAAARQLRRSMKKRWSDHRRAVARSKRRGRMRR